MTCISTRTAQHSRPTVRGHQLEPTPVPPQRASTPSPSNRVERAERTAHLLHRAARAGDRERRALHQEVVVLNMGVAVSVAARYRRHGVPTEDLHQVAYVALVKAVHGFDENAGTNFLSYSVPTIRGEIKRWFRDHGWTVRPPRRIQELQARMTTAESELSSALGRSPRPSEIAAHLGEQVEDVTEALTTDGCFTPTSLDRPVGEDATAVLGDLLGAEDRGREAAEARVVLAPVVRRLGARDRRILLLRFFHGWTQQEIAQDIGVTQMQVSRLLSRILTELRDGLADGPVAAGA